MEISWCLRGDADMRAYAEAMVYRIGPFELDLDRAELRADGNVLAVEPQVFSVLALLVANHERLVTHDELIEKVWDGRVVSEAAISSRIKSARRALGDDGTAQRLIRTVHRRGFRFVGDVLAVAGPGEAAAGASTSRLAGATSQPSIAVLAFRAIAGEGTAATLALALPHELIIEMARLRWLVVTARGSSFRLDPSTTGFVEIGRLLGVRYALAGTVELDGRRLVVRIELVDTADARVVWAERFGGAIDDVHEIRETILARTLVALEIRIPLHEAGRARLAGPGHLDAWASYHLGLQHLYRFNRADNAVAAQRFAHAVELDPGFARAHAGLSFVHFQTAFLRHTDDLDGEIAQAHRCAERGLELDALDPFVNFTMGRCLWLRGDLEGSLAWLERATAISPNYAQGIYARAWTEALSGRPLEGRGHVDHAMRLSPLDPMFYAMLGTRAFTHLALGEDAEAAAWAERAARAPDAHALIAMIAAAIQQLTGDEARARDWGAVVRARNAALGRADFFRSFPMKSAPMRSRLDAALGALGF